jgi:hypothetical protein
MKRLIIILCTILAANKSYCCDSCFIEINQKYILKIDSLIVSLTFINDTIYALRGEKIQDRWVSYGKWRKLSNKSILISPDKGGVRLRVEQNGRISKIDGVYFFNLKDETLEITCIKHEINIIIDDYVFK